MASESASNECKTPKLLQQKSRISLENVLNDLESTEINIPLCNNKTLKYLLCKYLFYSILTIFMFPIYIIIFPLVYINVKQWCNSRQIIVTNNELTISQNKRFQLILCRKRSVKGISISNINNIEAIHLNICGLMEISRLIISTNSQGNISIVSIFSMHYLFIYIYIILR